MAHIFSKEFFNREKSPERKGATQGVQYIVAGAPGPRACSFSTSADTGACRYSRWRGDGGACCRLLAGGGVGGQWSREEGLVDYTLKQGP